MSEADEFNASYDPALKAARAARPEPFGHIPSAGAEQTFCAAMDDVSIAAQLNSNRLRDNPGRSTMLVDDLLI